LDSSAGLSEDTLPQALNDFGLGSLTSIDLLTLTGLSGVTLNDVANFLYLGANPVSFLLAAAGFSDAQQRSEPSPDAELSQTALFLAYSYPPAEARC
jgi:hypothetical protein